MAKKGYRVEKDSLGSVQVPKGALYAAQTQRAVDNFPVSGLTFQRTFIQALGLVKASAAHANLSLKLLDAKRSKAIVSAASAVAAGKHDAHFPLDIFQTGSGTSTNMNANEVIATLATSKALKVHPNDHVNMSQSSNDVIPTAIHVSAALAVTEQLLPALSHLEKTLRKKIKQVDKVVKTGRTHLMDAMPVTLGQELSGWLSQVGHAQARIKDSQKRIAELALGGTAVGTGINAHPQFGKKVAAELTKTTGIKFVTAKNYFESLSSQDAAVEMSGQLKTLAASLMKMANDLRWMNSGPYGGLGEIQLPALQPGSSIMPGKVNPVIPESVAMVAAQVMGNDVTINVAGASGNFQLNVMLPVVGYNLLQSIEILSNASRILADKAIAGFKVNKAHVANLVDKNPILVTALNPLVGYELGATIAKRAYKEGRTVLDVAKEMTDLPEAKLKKALDPSLLTKGGIQK